MDNLLVIPIVSVVFAENDTKDSTEESSGSSERDERSGFNKMLKNVLAYCLDRI
jgi:hypothetical protein